MFEFLKNRLKTMALSLFIVILMFKIRNYIKRQKRVKYLEKNIANRRKERKNGILLISHNYKKTDATVRKLIVQLSFEDLRRAIADGHYTCVQVLHAYQEAALKADEETNCVTQFIIEAEILAADLDEKLKTLKNDNAGLPRLFGIPFSVKESMAIKGYDSTAGLAQFLNDPKSDDGFYIHALKEAGAIPFVITNLPQTMLTFASANPIYGETTHPHSKRLSPGGSSSGEGALLSLKGAVFGVGSDLAGSIRVPSALCGIYGLRPTNVRVSQIGHFAITPGRMLVGASVGPMGIELAAVRESLRAILDYDWRHKDYYVSPIPWRTIERRPLRIAYFESNDYFLPLPCIRKAVNEAKSVLEKLGHTLIRISVIDHERMRKIMSGLVNQGGRARINEIIKNDIIEPIHSALHLAISASRGDPNSRFFGQTSDQLREVFAQTIVYRREFMDLLLSKNIDCILSPANGSVSVPNSAILKTMGYICSYTYLYNVLDYPAGVIPWSKVTPQDIKETAQATHPNDQAHNLIYKLNSDPSQIGLPIAVQIAAPPNEEELILDVLAQLEENKN